MNLNAAGDFPTITASTYASSSGLLGSANFTTTPTVSLSPNWIQADDKGGPRDEMLREYLEKKPAKKNENTQPNPSMASTKRIVRVYLADVDDNIPLEKSVLFTGSEKLTDSTDQELYFEIPIMDLLTKHNAYRATVVDKKASQRVGKDVFLEPVKIRDLKMTVVNIATF